MTPESNAPSVDPQIIGNFFVHKYYNHLYESPAEVHRFYLEGSVLGRPGLDGEMVSVKSLKAINDQIMSFEYQYSKIHILSADSQPSLNSGVVTLVAGVMIGKDGGRRKFTQTFLLVPHRGSYFVWNDVFRYMSDASVESEATNEVEESSQLIAGKPAEPANENVEAVTEPVANGHVKVHKEKVVNGNTNVPKAAEAKPQEEAKAAEAKPQKEPKAAEAKPQEEPKAAEAKPQEEAKAAEAKPQGDAPKKSFAFIVQSSAQNGTVKASPAKPKPVEKPRVAPKPKAPEQASAETVEQPGQGGSIFVANLPMDATPEQLYETFIVFGPIRKGGVQVRSYTEKRNCFGFVAFESAEAVKSVFKAHKESPIRIGNRRASIEEKRGNSNQNGGGPSARNNGYNRNENGHRNDGHRPRGNGKASDGSNGHGNAQARN